MNLRLVVLLAIASPAALWAAPQMPANLESPHVEVPPADQPPRVVPIVSYTLALIWTPQPARAARLVLSLEEAAHVTALADQLGGARDYPAEAREKIYLSLQAQSRR